MQIMPETAERFGVSDICDPEENIDGGVRYLRDLTERARAQKFSVWPMITALLNARMEALEKANKPEGMAEPPKGQSAVSTTVDGQLEISSALRDSMKKKGW